MSGKRISVSTMRSLVSLASAAAVAACGLGNWHMQFMACVLVSLLLGGIRGMGALGLVMLAGICGIPVFAGDDFFRNFSGFSYFNLDGGCRIYRFAAASLVAGIAAGEPSDRKNDFLRTVLAALAAYGVSYGIEALFCATRNFSFEASDLTETCTDLLNLAVLVVLVFFLRPVFFRKLYSKAVTEREMEENLEKLKKLSK